MGQGDYKNFFNWKEEERHAQANPKSVAKKREFKMPRLPKMQMPGKKTLAIAAGIVVLGAVTFGLFNRKSSKADAKIVAVSEYKVNKDSLFKAQGDHIADSLYATTAQDFEKTKQELDSIYTEKLTWYDAEFKDKDSANSTSVDMAEWEADQFFKTKQSALSQAHPGLTFSLKNGVFAVAGNVQGGQRALNTAKVQVLKPVK